MRPRAASPGGGARHMSIFVSILGLGFLILIHEAGHFFVARAVGMNPRKFYLGFPPALVKTKRNGIEYGVGAIPLGGYVKIPGMHRPAPGDLDVYFGRAIEEEPSLRRPVDDLRQYLEASDYLGGRAAIARLAPQIAEARSVARPRSRPPSVVSGTSTTPSRPTPTGARRRGSASR